MSLKVTTSVSEAERHLRDIVTLAFHNGKLYTGAEDGKIKVWSTDLKLISEFQAHPVNVYSLAVTDDTLYSCSNDGTIQAWNLPSNTPKKTLQNNPNIEVLRLHLANGKLYSGEDKGNYPFERIENDGRWKLLSWTFVVGFYGKSYDKEFTSAVPAKLLHVPYTRHCWNHLRRIVSMTTCKALDMVRVWEKDTEVATYEMGEEVWDLLVHGNLLFTARNLDVNITEMIPGKGSQYTSRGVVEGRSPIRLVGNKLCFMSRCGRNILVHDTAVESRFKQLSVIKAHEMIVNALAVAEEPQLTLYSGGYDNTLKGWDVATEKCVGSLDLGVCINALCAGPKGEIYLASTNGHLSRIDAK